MKKSERLLAEKFLLQRIFEEDPDFVDKTMQAFSVSRSTVYNYINHLQDTGELERVGGSMPYRLTQSGHAVQRVINVFPAEIELGVLQINLLVIKLKIIFHIGIGAGILQVADDAYNKHDRRHDHLTFCNRFFLLLYLLWYRIVKSYCKNGGKRV